MRRFPHLHLPHPVLSPPEESMVTEAPTSISVSEKRSFPRSIEDPDEVASLSEDQYLKELNKQPSSKQLGFRVDNVHRMRSASRNISLVVIQTQSSSELGRIPISTPVERIV